MSQYYVAATQSTSPNVLFLEGNDSVQVGPNGSGIINVIGTGGVNVTGDAGDNTLTISVSSEGMSWTDKGSSFNAAVSNGYFITANATATLPSSPSQGDVVALNCISTGVVVIQAAAGQYIAGSTATSTEAGTCTSTEKGDAITLFYRAASSTWQAQSMIGMFSFA